MTVWKTLTGVDRLRAMVKFFGDVNEEFNQRYSVEELERIYSCYCRSEFRVYPDGWEPWQIEDALALNLPPKFSVDIVAEQYTTDERRKAAARQYFKALKKG